MTGARVVRYMRLTEIRTSPGVRHLHTFLTGVSQPNVLARRRNLRGNILVLHYYAALKIMVRSTLRILIDEFSIH